MKLSKWPVRDSGYRWLGLALFVKPMTGQFPPGKLPPIMEAKRTGVDFDIVPWPLCSPFDPLPAIPGRIERQERLVLDEDVRFGHHQIVKRTQHAPGFLAALCN